ncbi:unnamed protein product [Dicrocoelium dendriticum]|nr:unnamed protein product [Dicrocoelium dendriticum]
MQNLLVSFSSIIIQRFVPDGNASHILSFVMQKLNIPSTIDFHTALYMCAAPFQSMEMPEYLSRFLKWSQWIVPGYIYGMFKLSQLRWSMLSRTARKLSTRQNHTDTKHEQTHVSITELWHALHNIAFGLLAWSTVRMKYLWTPHLLLVASIGLIHLHSIVSTACIYAVNGRLTYRTRQHLPTDEIVQHSKGSRHQEAKEKTSNMHSRWARWMTYSSLCVLASHIGLRTAAEFSHSLQELGEFYDPDTVALMEWIQGNTDPNAIFTGSMQLMAGVKLCTGRPIANHPHYEDAGLRERTRKWPDLWVRNNNLVRTGQLNAAYTLDTATRISLKRPALHTFRFCEQLIDLARSSSHFGGAHLRQITKFFKVVFQNPTFYVFKVNEAI